MAAPPLAVWTCGFTCGYFVYDSIVLLVYPEVTRAELGQPEVTVLDLKQPEGPCNRFIETNMGKAASVAEAIDAIILEASSAVQADDKDKLCAA